MVRYNEDAEVVARIKEGLKKKNGYCPCRLEMTWQSQDLPTLMTSAGDCRYVLQAETQIQTRHRWNLRTD